MSEEQFLTPIPVDQLAKRDDIRKHSVRGVEQVKVPFENISTRPGFNERSDFGDIEGLAQSILDDGLLFAIWVDMLSDGTCLLVDGERRFKAIQWLRTQGHEYDQVPAIIIPKGWTDVDRIFFMLQANNGAKQFDDIELGRTFIRLVNYGISQAEISKRMGNMSEMVVGNRIAAAKLTTKEKKSIEAGEISLTAAVAFVKREPNPAIRQNTIKQAIDSGKKKLKVSDVLDKAKRDKEEKAIIENPEAVAGFTRKEIQTPSESFPSTNGINSDPFPGLESPATGLLMPNYKQFGTPLLNDETPLKIIGECLSILKTMESFIELGNIGGEYTLKLENRLRQLKILLS